jgi:hypothetical protein
MLEFELRRFPEEELAQMEKIEKVSRIPDQPDHKSNVGV